MKKNDMMNSHFMRALLKWCIMIRVLWIIIVSSALQASAGTSLTYSQTVKLNLKLNKVDLEQVIWSIEKQTKFNFFYSTDEVRKVKDLDVDLENATAEEVLDQCLKGTNLTYEIVHKTVIIKMAPVIKTNATSELIEQQPQKKDIKGKVSDTKGGAIPGTTVIIKGTTIGTLTDVNGAFNLQIPLDAQFLIISFIGYSSQEIAIGSNTTFNVVLEEANVNLEDVVVVGYGVQKKESVVGAISQTTNEQLKQTGNVTDLKQALTGQLPGITTITSSGEPGGTGTGKSATSIFIRGQNTWNGGQPLILVDGAERSMDNLDVSEVESISVLKDASATAVFGVKGANGVILVTTKRGTRGKPKLSFSYNATALTVSKLPGKLDSYNTLLIKNEAIEREVVLNETSWADYVPIQLVNRYKLPQTPEYSKIYPNVNWVDAMFKDMSMSHRAALNVQGGTSVVNYFGSLTFLHEGDMFKNYENYKGYSPNNSYDRFNFRSNFDFKITRTTKLSVNLSGYYGQKNTNNSYANTALGTNPLVWSAAYRMPPDVFLPQYSDGRWGASYKLPAEEIQNPVALIYNTGILEIHTTELDANFDLEQNLDFITKGLNAKVSLFYDNNLQSSGGLVDENAVRPESGSNTPQKVIFSELYTGPNQDPSEYTQNIPTSGSYLFDWAMRPWAINPEVVKAAEYTSYIPIERRMMYQFQLNYARKFNLHNVGAMGIVKREEYALGSMFKNYREDWVFRTTYDYDTRYLFEMNGAYNGSEQFGPGYRFDFFPSIAVGWYVSNEKFFKVDWINRLKLRFSSGMVGDDKGSGGRWLYASQYSYGGYSPLNQDPNQASPYTWYKESVVGNPDIHWEKALKNNYGLEMGLFDNLISLNYDYFTEDRTDIMLAGNSRFSIPSYYGINPPSANVGRVKSNGHEIELKLDKRTHNGLHYWGSVALSHIKNEVLAKDDPQLLPSYQKNQGYSIGQTRTEVRAGFYNNWDEVYASVPQETNDLAKLPGYYNILDFNGDGVISSSGDYIPYGYSEIPQNTYNFTLGADYKGLSFMVQFYGVNNVSRYVPLSDFYKYQDVLFDHVMDYWSKDNPNASSYIPRWKTEGQFIGDYFVYDGSYLRLKTAEIAYTFKDKWVRSIGLSNLRIYLNGNNLIFWSKLPDDREAAWSGGEAADGAYPTPKRFNLGFDLTF